MRRGLGRFAVVLNLLVGVGLASVLASPWPGALAIRRRFDRGSSGGVAYDRALSVARTVTGNPP